MTALTKLAALRMQEAEVLRTECAGCGHSLQSHPLSRRIEGTRCRHFHVVSHSSGNPDKAKLAYCKCKAWVEPDSQLAL